MLDRVRPPAPFWPSPAGHLATIAAAFAGAALFHLIGLPAAWLSGAMVGVAVLVAVGGRPAMLAPVRNAGMLLGGLTLGSSVTPELLSGIGHYPASVALFVLNIAVIMIATQVFLVRVCHWDRPTAFFASAPGALSSVLSVAADTRADILGVSIVQAVRLFVLVAIVPSIVSLTGDGRVVTPVETAGALEMTGMIVVGAGLSALLDRLGMAGPWIFGGMAVSAVLHGSGSVHGSLPEPFTVLAYLLVGAFIGTRFTGIDGGSLRRLLVPAAGALLIGLTLSVAISLATARLLGVPFGAVLVAFAPGGLEAMIVLGGALGLDPIYVGLHHLLRFFGLSLLLPLAAHLFARRGHGGDRP